MNGLFCAYKLLKIFKYNVKEKKIILM